MNRPSSKRVFALLWAILFLLSTAGEGFGLRPCPYHRVDGDGHCADHSLLPPADSPHAGHAMDAPVDAEPAESGGLDLCDHTEACHLSGVPVLAVRPPSFLIFTAFTEAQERPVPESRPSQSHPPYFLPYSQAPPPLA